MQKTGEITMQNYTQVFGQNVEHLTETQKMLAEQVSGIFQTALNSTVKLMELQTVAAQDAFQRKLDLLEEAKGVKKGEDIIEFQKKFYQTETDSILNQSRKVTDIFFETQEQIEKLTLDNFAEVNDTVNDAIDRGFKAANGSASHPAALLLKQGIETQREAFSQVYNLARENWEQNFSQLRDAARKGADQVQEVQQATQKQPARGRRKA